jgi:hypothetical protein
MKQENHYLKLKINKGYKMKTYKEFLNESKDIIEEQDVALLESTLKENVVAKKGFEQALKSRDAEIKVGVQNHPMGKGKYSIKIYSPSTDKNTTFYADILDFRGDYMS